jgi:hypothetical protein
MSLKIALSDSSGRNGMPKARKKSSVNRATKKAKTPQAAPYGIARNWKRANLVTQDFKPLPASTISKVLSLTGFQDLKSLDTKIGQYNRHEIAKSLQKRLIRCFSVKVDRHAVDEPIKLKVDRKSYTIPYPFKADGSSEWTCNIGAISFEEKANEGTLEIGITIYIEVPSFLTPRKKTDREFCNLLLDAIDLESATDEEKAVISSWLISNGMTDTDAKKVIANYNPFVADWFSDISSRIRSMVDIFGAAGLISDNAEDTCVLDAADFYDEFI